MKKTKLHSLEDLAMVYSTHPEANSSRTTDEASSSIKKSQVVRVQLQRLKGGKLATQIKGLEESEGILDDICKQIKQKCGVGGSAKNSEIILQGDQVNKVIAFLIQLGYTNTKRSGG